MSGVLTIDACGETACLVPPAEFVRLRYFFGQRLGVIDLADEQSYLVGKQRFHNLLGHGVGVLCGLKSTRYVSPQSSPPTTATTLLRVSRGAALDGCGREIVVGWDQCIDVASWFLQHPAAAGSAVAGSLRLWVALCYRECPSDPSPAPRDPCGCETSGCEFARIREGFELSLLTDEEAEALTGAPVGAGAEPDGPPDLSALLSGAGCPEPLPDACLLLASVQAALDSTGKKVVDLSAPDNAIPERRTLLRTSVLQALLLETAAAAGSSGLTGSGPRFSTVAFANGGADSGTLSIALLTDATGLSRDPFAAPTQLDVHVTRFMDDGSWTAAPGFTASYVPGPPPRIEVQWAAGAGLVDDGRYRVLIESDRTQPPVDLKMKPLTPSSWAHHFRLVVDAGNLVLADSLFA
jgi:hypothetical protein